MGALTDTGSRFGKFLARLESYFEDVALLEVRRQKLAYKPPHYLGGLSSGEEPDLHNFPCYWVSHQMEGMADNFRSGVHDSIRIQFFFAHKIENDRQMATNYVLWAAETMTKTMRDRRLGLRLAQIERVLAIPELLGIGVAKYRLEYKCYLV